jgi:MFS transporter, OFA family, oxalate/formate antiporter
MKNRWAVALAGTVTMICLGTVYSWSLFTQPLMAGFGWSNSTVTRAFSLAIFFLGVGAIIGGRWQDRAGPRSVVVTGALLWGIGNILTGVGTAKFGAWWL